VTVGNEDLMLGKATLTIVASKNARKAPNEATSRTLRSLTRPVRPLLLTGWVPETAPMALRCAVLTRHLPTTVTIACGVDGPISL